MENIEAIAHQCADILRTRPCGYFTDYDGVCSEIAPTPEQGVPWPGAPEAVGRLLSHVDIGGFLTGRAVDDVLRMMNLPTAMAVGNHGLEWFVRGERTDHPAGVDAIEGVRLAIDDIRREISADLGTNGMLFENKRLSGSVHFRNVADPARWEAALTPIVEQAAAANGLRVVPGKMIFELRPEQNLSKGSALETLVHDEQLKAAIFFGDDVSDVDGFLTLQRLRREEGIRTLAIGVASDDVNPLVVDHADVLIHHPSENVVLLNRIADLLEDPA